MRGKVSQQQQDIFRWRITPAYAGKSITEHCLSGFTRDHPRLCGEKHMEVYAICDITGSPPPMRGKAHGGVCHLRHHRITPAYAGKSRDSGVVVAVVRDHPRLCGEKCQRCVWSCPCEGSPPPMRGKERARNVLKSIIRITPAYAGKSERL